MKSSRPEPEPEPEGGELRPSEAVRERVRTLLLDAFGCAAIGRRAEPGAAWTESLSNVSGTALLWFDGRRTDAAHAALVNGTIAHHLELDDGHPGASFHGGVSVIPAAVAVAEEQGRSGAELVDAVALGYATAAAYGTPLVRGIESERAHPPARVGGFGAAAAVGSLMGLSAEAVRRAVTLAGTMAPLAPFEAFTRGASVKDLYGGYPAYVGVEAARFAAFGLAGPEDVAAPALDLEAVLGVYIKPWASCRSNHAALTALEKLLPYEDDLEEVRVETYPFAAELSADADAGTAIGAKTSIESMFVALGGPAFARAAFRITGDLPPRRARVTLRSVDGTETRAEADAPRDEHAPLEKFRRNAGPSARAIERAVAGLTESDDLLALTSALSTPHPPDDRSKQASPT